MPSKSFVFYKDGVPMDTFYLQADTAFSQVEREAHKILKELGWIETDFTTAHEAHISILKSVLKPGDGMNDPRMWARQGEECRRRRDAANCITYPELINLARKRLGKKYYIKEGKVVPARKTGNEVGKE
jgi:hypothetical protein